MMSAKMATLGVLEIKVLQSKVYDVIISEDAVTNKILSRDSIFSVDIVLCLKSGDLSISLKEVIITSILRRFDWKNHLLWGSDLGSSLMIWDWNKVWKFTEMW